MNALRLHPNTQFKALYISVSLTVLYEDLATHVLKALKLLIGF